MDSSNLNDTTDVDRSKKEISFSGDSSNPSGIATNYGTKQKSSRHGELSALEVSRAATHIAEILDGLSRQDTLRILRMTVSPYGLQLASVNATISDNRQGGNNARSGTSQPRTSEQKFREGEDKKKPKKKGKEKADAKAAKPPLPPAMFKKSPIYLDIQRQIHEAARTLKTEDADEPLDDLQKGKLIATRKELADLGKMFRDEFRKDKNFCFSKEILDKFDFKNS